MKTNFMNLNKKIKLIKNFAKKLFYFSSNCMKLFYGQFIIRYHDKEINKNLKRSKNKFLKKGWLISKTNEFFNNKFELQIDNQETDKSGNFISRNISKDTLINILNSKKLVKLVNSYLGNGARLDDIYIWKKDSSNLSREDLSCAWHTDNVGHRLKMFIALDLSISPPVVQFQNNSHLNEYKFSFIEIFRHLKLKISEGNKKYVSFNISNNQLFIFDTNSKHRDYCPKYDPFHRLCLVIEFIDRKKSNKISGTHPCGPGQNKKGELIFDKSMKKVLLANPLIDEKILKENDLNFTYSISNY